MHNIASNNTFANIVVPSRNGENVNITDIVSPCWKRRKAKNVYIAYVVSAGRKRTNDVTLNLCGDCGCEFSQASIRDRLGDCRPVNRNRACDSGYVYIQAVGHISTNDRIRAVNTDNGNL